MARKPPLTYSMARLALGAVVALCALAPAPASAATACPGADTHPKDTSLSQTSRATLCLLNSERRKRGIRPLASNSRLAAAAERHARDMDRRNYFSHSSPGGTDMLDRVRSARYIRPGDSWTVGENIAWGSEEYATPRSIVRIWMHSPGHKANILRRRFREIGVGVARGAPERGVGNAAIYATNFGARG